MSAFAYPEAALLVVDLQCGFTTLCPDELPVPGGLEIVPAVNRLLALPWRRIDASFDWHPPDHCSFRPTGPYPPHCVAGTRGAEPVPGVETSRYHALWRKGMHQDADAYAVTAAHPGLPSLYRAEGIQTVAVCGLAVNICCFFAARDLRKAGFRVLLLEDASAGLDVPAAGLYQARAREEGRALGIEYGTGLFFADEVASVRPDQRA